MLDQVLSCLALKGNDVIVDCTLGEGGHSFHFLKKLKIGLVIGIEQDEVILQRAVERLHEFDDHFIPVRGNFSFLKDILKETIKTFVDKIFFDLGISMYHFKASGRGFSFSKDEPLDMRLDQSRSLRARDVVNKFDKKRLVEIIWAYGEEKFSSRIAQFIVREREKNPITTSIQLADIIKNAIPKKYWPKNIHPATRTFQAIRIFINDEIDILEKALRDAVSCLNPGGRICVISFHSLEDRIVKSVFKDLTGGCSCPPDFPVCVCGKKRLIKIETKKPMVPEEAEIAANPASRGAKLRCATRLDIQKNQVLDQDMKVTA
jgi:16S rRNA (cytosine1402-N4)-methyltransferase